MVYLISSCWNKHCEQTLSFLRQDNVSTSDKNCQRSRDDVKLPEDKAYVKTED